MVVHSGCTDRSMGSGGGEGGGRKEGRKEGRKRRRRGSTSKS